MRRLMIAGLLAMTTPFGLAAVPAAAQAPYPGQGYDGGPPPYARNDAVERRWADAQSRYRAETQRYQTERDRYQRSRGGAGYGYAPQPNGYDDRDAPGPGGYAPPPPPGRQAYADDRDENGYDAARYYRGGANYGERTLASDDRVYAGSDGRYYCKRNDGTTGLIIGAASGGILGNVIDGGHSRAAGTLIGGALGAIIGKSVEQNASIRCR